MPAARSSPSASSNFLSASSAASPCRSSTPSDQPAAGLSLTVTGTLAFCLLLLPTFLMGSTLPLLVEHLSSRTHNVGEAVGLLYCVNALGSGCACWLAAILLMRVLGLHGVVGLAALLNLVVAASALYLDRKRFATQLSPHSPISTAVVSTRASPLPMWLGMLLAASVRIHRAGIRDRLVSPLLIRHRQRSALLREAAGLLPPRPCLRLVRSPRLFAEEASV